MSYNYEYPRPAVTADCVVVTNEPLPKVLLIQRGAEPFKGAWAFPGGFMNMDETTEQCAIRELEEETGLKVDTLYQVGAYSKVDRDQRGRTITVAYLAIIDSPVEVIGQDDAAKAEWFPITSLPNLAFDHQDILKNAMVVYARNVEIRVNNNAKKPKYYASSKGKLYLTVSTHPGKLDEEVIKENFIRMLIMDGDVSAEDAMEEMENMSWRKKKRIWQVAESEYWSPEIQDYLSQNDILSSFRDDLKPITEVLRDNDEPPISEEEAINRMWELLDEFSFEGFRNYEISSAEWD